MFFRKRRLVAKKSPSSPSTPRSPKRGVLQSTHLQQVNEEMYKRNVELAVKNKTLSLLRSLYEISSHTLQPKLLGRQTVDTIRKTLNLPFVGIYLANGKERKLEFFSFSASTAIAKQIAPFVKKKNPSISLSSRSHICVNIIRKGEKGQSGEFASFFESFFPVEVVDGLRQHTNVKTTLAYPLVLDKKKLGVLVLSLETPYAKLNRFEKESISSFVTVVAVALEKALIYEQTTLLAQSLQKANVRLQELDQLKTEFLSIASHQLRTPLSIIKGYTELIEDGAYGKVTKQMREVLGNVDESNERLIKLVDEFLNISRIEQGRTQYTFEPYDISETIKSVVTELQAKASKKSIEISTKIDLLPTITGDEDKIRHSIYNFVDNAIKYSADGSSVHVKAFSSVAGVTVSVKDSGAGLDKKDLDNLFSKFYRSPHVMREVQGTGLGLYVVRQFIAAHGGRAWAKSKGVGKGSEFIFFVPLTPPKSILKDLSKKQPPKSAAGAGKSARLSDKKK